MPISYEKARNTDKIGAFTGGRGTAVNGLGGDPTMQKYPTSATPSTFNSRRPQRGRKSVHYDKNGDTTIPSGSTRPQR